MQDPPKNCKKCTRPDEAENMVGCDGCDAWEHYGCAGVSDSIAGSSRSWMCEDCRRRALATTGASSTVSAYTSASSKKSRQAQLRLELLEQQKLVRIKRLEEEERYLKDKFEILMQLEEEDEIASNRSRVSTSSKRDRLQKWLEQAETGVPEGDIDAERGAVRKNVGFEASQASASGRTLTAPAFETQLVSGKLDKQASVVREPDFSTPNPMKTISTMTADANRADRKHISDNVVASPIRQRTQQFELIPPNSEHKSGESANACSWNTHPPVSDAPRSSCAIDTTRIKSLTPGIDSVRKYARMDKHENLLSGGIHPRLPYPHSAEQLEIPPEMNSPSRTVHSSPQSRIEESGMHRPEPIHFGPTASQLAARQVMPRDLPIFAGDPEDWPIFYSSFKNSTQVCGYSDAENLSRLQRCLRGTALESVRSRLLLPSSVDSVIATLRMLFGRPEILINALLKRVRSSPAPKAENLKSIVDYGLAVQNLIDHMIVSQQQDHLNNPLLLNELVEKPPTNFKLQWSSFKQEQSNVNLATFNNFVSNLVFLASDLLVTSDSYQAILKGNRPEKQKEKLFVHAQEPPFAMDHSEHHDYSHHMNHSTDTDMMHHGHEGHHGSMEHSLQDHTMDQGAAAHAGGAHGGHAGMVHHMMSMAFHGGYNETILFEQWKIDSLSGLLWSMLVIFIMAALYEGLKYYREHLFWKTYNALQYRPVTVTEKSPGNGNVANNNGLATNGAGGDEASRVVHMVGEVIHKQPRPTMLSTMHLFQTFLHILQVTLSFLLMLIFMTYNTWLCVAVVLGAALGYFLFGWKKSVIVDVTEHCH